MCVEFARAQAISDLSHPPRSGHNPLPELRAGVSSPVPTPGRGAERCPTGWPGANGTRSRVCGAEPSNRGQRERR